MELSAGKLWGLRRLADAGGHFTMLAVDQRPPIIDRVREVRGTDAAPYGDVCAVKRALIEALGPRASALLLDPLYAYPTAIDAVSPAQGLLVTLETHRFRETPQGRFAAEIPDWGVAKIKRLGADAVKVLAHYRPDGPEESRRHQEAFVERIGRDCARYDIPYLLECYRAGALDLRALVTREIALDAVGDALSDLATGAGARSVVVFD